MYWRNLELMCYSGGKQGKCETPTIVIGHSNNGCIICPHCKAELKEKAMIYIIDTDALGLYCKPDEKHAWGREFVFEMKSGYCGKILELQLPNVASSIHHHEHTDETLVVLSGKVGVWINHPPFNIYSPGQKIDIKRGEKHQFMSYSGSALMLEVSNRQNPDDDIKVPGSGGRIE